jgi:pyruvate/2-oxoacid:ferredoxin oxidoreductase beta subunit
MSTTAPSTKASPPVPHSFKDFVGAFGPGIIVVLTWLGAGDVVDMGVAGSNYGYSLLWVLVIAVFMRFILVSAIGRYQLCNQHGESVLDGLVRLHRWYAPILFVGAIVMGHVYESYMTVGVGEVVRNMTGLGETWMWAIVFNAVAFILVLQGEYKPLEWVFKFFLAVLSISFLGSAIWVGLIYTLQGDGDMVSEGLAEVLHIAARGESITCLMLDNGVFGDTGGQMTATTTVGQRTKTDLDGRSAGEYGHPIAVADIVATFPGVAYVARGAVDKPNSIARTRRYLRSAFEAQMNGEGFSLVEILTMCPTGWAVPTDQGADYQRDQRGAATGLGELRARV